MSTPLEFENIPVLTTAACIPTPSSLCSGPVVTPVHLLTGPSETLIATTNLSPFAARLPPEIPNVAKIEESLKPETTHHPTSTILATSSTNIISTTFFVAPSKVASAVIDSPQTLISKKNKNTPQFAMATAPTTNSSGSTAGENTGRWTAEEHRLFLQGLEQHGKGWKKIASLIKSRTVVQIRTHAQKYFQKLSKARQNGEEGEISMDSRGGPSAIAVGLVTIGGVPVVKRRRHTTGTKRKAISSVVSSAHREGKKMAATQETVGVPCPIPHLPAVAPALAPFLLPAAQLQSGTTTPTTIPAVTAAHGALSGPALEDSLFRFLTPAPMSSETHVQVNEVARQAGANPITLPSDQPSVVPSAGGGEISPHGVTDIAIFPSWTDAKDMPSWYQRGADVDALLDCADTLDWLSDTGDLHETFDAISMPQFIALNSGPPVLPQMMDMDLDPLTKNSSVSNIAHDAMANDTDVDVPPLPSLFGSELSSKRQKSGSMLSYASSYASIDTSLDVFDNPMEEHAFMSALLENNGESSASLPALQ